MMTLCLLLCGCGGAEKTAPDLLERYRTMSGCTMEAEVSCDWEGLPWSAGMRCDYVPEGESTIELLSPETLAGVTVVLEEDTWYLRVGEKTLDAGSVSPEKISPAACLPRMMHALRNGWLLEENEESWQGVACRRVAVDQSGEQGTILTTLWLRQEDGTPLRGEIAVDGERVLTAEFTSFAFCDTIPEAASAPQ
ncbi:MAG: hypothetical protein IJ221_09740 [Oscillibacter sp.]|nr:hypothetical protein [Oscillibacter sp.]